MRSAKIHTKNWENKEKQLPDLLLLPFHTDQEEDKRCELPLLVKEKQWVDIYNLSISDIQGHNP